MDDPKYRCKSIPYYDCLTQNSLLNRNNYYFGDKKGHIYPYQDPRFFKNLLKSNMFDRSVRFGTKFAQYKIKIDFLKHIR